MAVTMKEIAYMCGVSRGTVDRVLNNRGHVRSETEERIRATAKAMGYRAMPPAIHPAASEKNMKIGVIINAMDHPYFAEILSGVISGIEKLEEYNITGNIKLSGGFDVDQQLHFLNELQQEVNILIITPANNSRIADKLQEYADAGIPVITVSALVEGFEPFATVSSDHYNGGRIAAGFAKLLLPKGGKIAVVTGSNSQVGLTLRNKGFSEVIHDAGNEFTVLTPIQSFDDDIISYKSLSGLISRHPDINLVFIAAGGFNGCYQALEDAKMLGNIPVIAFDTGDVNLTKLKQGVISALFSQKPTKQGKLAVKIASEYLLSHSTPSKRNYYVRTEILIAESIYDFS